MTNLTRAITVTLVGWVSTMGTGTPAGGIRSLEAQETGAQRAVLVTGATTGIGRKTAELLAQRGFFVYAGARKERDMAELNAIENIQAIRLDVTIQEEIDAAVETIRAAGRGLYGLINNAGVVVVAPLIEVGEEDLEFQLDVNVLGPYRVTKAFAPLIIESRGRISTTGSLSGIVTWPLGGPYTMSKHAVEAFSEVLAAEMAGFGVQVSVVEPGNYSSQIFQNMAARYAERGYTPEGSRYQAQMRRILGVAENPPEEPEPDAVAEAFFHALTDAHPKRHYLVVPVQQEAAVTIQAAIRRLVELNADHEFSFDRDQLIEFLDRALANAR
jgi:NAD(P)-dependent dehydrogenase (short-subunit alcohol dehydrogenase family)